MTTPPLLELRGVQAGYGAITALSGVSLAVGQGEIVTLIGANGAGKSTTLMSISGVLPARAGEILLDGQPIHRRTPGEIVRLGVVQVPEGRRIFPRLSVAENLELGAYCRNDPDGVLRDRAAVHALFPVLSERSRQMGGTLSGGEQQMLAIGRALLAGPRLLLLDEPSLGLAPLMVRQIFETIVRMNRERGTTILLVEQNAHLALQIAHRGYMLKTGRAVIEGTGADLLDNPAVRTAYLGAGS
ncbi:MAG: ABC transporter ATP-binding protein [Candidatus Methylomirabilia bacterium]